MTDLIHTVSDCLDFVSGDVGGWDVPHPHSRGRKTQENSSHGCSIFKWFLSHTMPHASVSPSLPLILLTSDQVMILFYCFWKDMNKCLLNTGRVPETEKKIIPHKSSLIDSNFIYIARWQFTCRSTHHSRSMPVWVITPNLPLQAHQRVFLPFSNC